MMSRGRWWGGGNLGPWEGCWEGGKRGGRGRGRKIKAVGSGWLRR